MELHELHVAQLGAGAVGGGHAVAGGHRRVGRLAVDHAGARRRRGSSAWPRRADRPRRPPRRPINGRPTQRPSCVSRSIVKVSSQMVTFGASRAWAMMARMTSWPVASPRAWTMRRWLWPPSRVRARWPSSRSKCVPQRIEVVDRLRGVADDQLDDGAVAQAGAGGERVLDVVLEAILGGEHAGDAALGVGRVDSAMRSLVTTSTSSGGGTARAARSPAMPAPMTSTSVNRWAVVLGANGTR